MAKHRSSGDPSNRAAEKPPQQDDEQESSRKKPARISVTRILISRSDDGSWKFQHPRCAQTRGDDLDEVLQMIAAGEMEIARDELRWLLADCHDFLAAHKLLGDVALADNDVRLARGHFGYAYQIGLQAIDRAGAKTMPFRHAANQPFHEAGKGLAMCLLKLGKRGLARDVIRRLLELDPSDPLNVRNLTDAARRGRSK